MSSQADTTGGPATLWVTAGGYKNFPFEMALGDYVTTSSPLLVGEPPMVLDRQFAGGQVPHAIAPFKTQVYQSNEEVAAEEIRRSELYFISHVSELVAKFEDRFVAIIDNHVVDSDTTIDRLMERVYKRFGYRPILMRKVHREIDRPSRLPSPKGIRSQ
jgi:hypothetical protein